MVPSLGAFCYELRRWPSPRPSTSRSWRWISGLSCACETAKAGLLTAVFERGAECGSKNVSGGRIYIGPLSDVLPEFWRDATFEGLVSREALSLVAGGTCTTMELHAPELGRKPFQSHTVLRTKLDKWLADQATAAGAMVLPESRVERVVIKDGRATGVAVGEEEIPAHVVVAADGALSLLGRGAGLNPGPRSGRLALGVKEIVRLEPGRIEDRFGLEPGRGAARMLVGDFTKGLPGGGFLYTNKDSVSVGVVARLDRCRRGRKDRSRTRSWTRCGRCRTWRGCWPEARRPSTRRIWFRRRRSSARRCRLRPAC